MIKMKSHRQRIPVVTAFLMTISLLVASGCGDGDSTSSRTGEGQMVITMHDMPVDQFNEIWLTVESVTLIHSDTEAGMEDKAVLTEPVRMDFLALDSVATILVAADVAAGSYSKLRMDVSNPEFVRDDDSVFTEPQVQLVANGHVDINFQQAVVIQPETMTVIDLDLDLENGIQVTGTGNGRYILRPQIIVDISPDNLMPVVVAGATVVSVNVDAGTLTVLRAGDGFPLTVHVSDATEITSSAGLSLELPAVIVGSQVNLEGELDVSTGVVTASVISIML